MSESLAGYLEQLHNRIEADTAPKASSHGTSHKEPDSVDPLFNDVDPAYVIKHEKPEHRIVIFLKAQGFSNREIAERTGMTTTAIGYILKQPWARARLLAEIQSAGRDGVHELLKGAVDDCVLTLIDIQADEKARASDRISASTAILDRFFGKPTQRVESINTNVTASMNDVTKMKQELAEVDSELQRLTGSGASGQN